MVIPVLELPLVRTSVSATEGFGGNQGKRGFGAFFFGLRKNGGGVGFGGFGVLVGGLMWCLVSFRNVWSSRGDFPEDKLQASRAYLSLNFRSPWAWYSDTDINPSKASAWQWELCPRAPVTEAWSHHKDSPGGFPIFRPFFRSVAGGGRKPHVSKEQLQNFGVKSLFIFPRWSLQSQGRRRKIEISDFVVFQCVWLKSFCRKIRPS